jgi:HlyD family secretion protein
MKTGIYVLIIVLAAASAAYAGWRFTSRYEEAWELLLHGNVDLRQVDLPFNGQQKIAAVLVEEGDRVVAGQTLARLETQRLDAAVAEAAAKVEAQRRVIERLENGTRPEEIEQARANVGAADADLAKARNDYERVKSLNRELVSPQELDSARFSRDAAAAKQNALKHTLDLAIAGPRVEDRAEAKATLSALEAQLALRQRELADATLRSPVTGVVRNRILEPGEMSSPSAPAITIAVTDPKWVRAYVEEPDLGKVRPGTPAVVTVDAFRGREFEGWVGFVSPVAEFTPKNVETSELRTSLVYEVRVFFRDPQDALRLGMPATVRVRPSIPATRPAN